MTQETKLDPLKTAFHAGRRAAEHGLSIEDAPESMTAQEREAWRTGWVRAITATTHNVGERASVADVLRFIIAARDGD